MATHSSILAWRIPWTEEPGGLQPWGYKELHMTEQETLSTAFVNLYDRHSEPHFHHYRNGVL